MSASQEYVWRGKASDPSELADEIAALPSSVLRLPSVEPLEIVQLTMSVANRDLIVRALSNHKESGTDSRSPPADRLNPTNQRRT